jgi:hypothetical protein
LVSGSIPPAVSAKNVSRSTTSSIADPFWS